MVAVWQPGSTFRAWEGESTLGKHCIIDEIIKEYERGQFLHDHNLRWTMNEGVIVEMIGWDGIKLDDNLVLQRTYVRCTSYEQ